MLGAHYTCEMSDFYIWRAVTESTITTAIRFDEVEQRTITIISTAVYIFRLVRDLSSASDLADIE